MKRMFAICIAILLSTTFAPEVSADDGVYQRSGTEREKHAQAIFTGVFGQCRDKAKKDVVEGVVAVVFSVGESGKFGATSTFKAEDGESSLRTLARCMGERANHARYFPRSNSKAVVGVKFVVSSDGELMMLGAGEATTLRDGDVFRWARKTPGGGSS